MPSEEAQEAEATDALPNLANASTELERANPRPSSLFDFGPDHKKRFHEATVKERETRAQQASDDRALREKIAKWVSWAIGAQVAVADLVFLTYGFGNDWHIPGSTMNAWLGATVVQVIAVGLVITRSLFPSKDP